jgi:hypothetical protein
MQSLQIDAVYSISAVTLLLFTFLRARKKARPFGLAFLVLNSEGVRAAPAM